MSKDLQVILGVVLVSGIIVWAYNKEKNKHPRAL
jgi:hypothetical protein